MRAFLFALDPTPDQEQAFRSHCGAQRFAFNFGLALVRANLEQRAAERSYGIAEAGLTPAVSWSAYGLRRPPCRTAGVAATWPGPAHRAGSVEPVAQGARPRRPDPRSGGEPAPQ
jgi:putative transposase